jgi:hypothetical protein
MLMFRPRQYPKGNLLVGAALILALFWLPRLGDMAAVRQQIGPGALVLPVITLVDWPCRFRRSAYVTFGPTRTRWFCARRGGGVAPATR